MQLISYVKVWLLDRSKQHTINICLTLHILLQDGWDRFCWDSDNFATKLTFFTVKIEFIKEISIYMCVCVCIYIDIASPCHISNLTKLTTIVMALTLTIASTECTFSYMKLKKIGSVIELVGTLEGPDQWYSARNIARLLQSRKWRLYLWSSILVYPFFVITQIKKA